MEDKNKKVILINTLYSGSYIFDKVGGEVINLHQSDNGRFYVYVTPYGNCPLGKDVKSIIFTRSVKGGAKVIGKAEGLTLADGANGAFDKNNRTLNSLQKKFVETNKIEYGGVSLSELGSWSSFCVTYEAESIHLAKKDIYLLNGSGKNSNDPITIFVGNKVANQSQKLYVNCDNPIYGNLQSLIEDKSCWEEDPVKKVDLSNHYTNNSLSVLEVAHRMDDENAVSNILAYFIKYNDLFWEFFVTQVLKLPYYNGSRDVIRERIFNIDLFIELEDTCIVIENKIKSGINGKSETQGYSQLKKYYDDVEANYQKSESNKYFLLRPNYNKEDISKYDDSEKYTKINYSDIKKIVDQIYNVNDKKFGVMAPEWSILWNELRALCDKHSKEFDNELYEVVNKRFIDQINLAKSKKIVK